jgi:hypothetical protein
MVYTILILILQQYQSYTAHPESFNVNSDVLQVVKWSAYTETTIFIDTMDNLNLTDLIHAEILFTSKFLFIIYYYFFYLVCLS